MKKFFTFCFFLINYNLSFANLIVVDVTNVQFTPANVNVTVGDVVRFNFVNGFHNATTNNVPGGLPAGADPLYSGTPAQVTRYDYTITQPGIYRYVCEVHADAATYTGMVGQITASAAVPVVLNYFNILPGNKTPVLNWVTASEQNSDHFSVLSSIDGIHFNEVSRINAAGSSSTDRSYTYTDENFPRDKQYIYYELAMVDVDGRQKLSPIRLFKNNVAARTLINSISPNPVTRPGQLMVWYNAQAKGKMHVDGYDGSGKKVMTSDMDCAAGINSGHLHVCDLPPGNYTMKFRLDGLSESRTIIVK